MTKQQEFINWVEELIKGNSMEPTEGAQSFWEALKNSDVPSTKPAFTYNGKVILQWLQSAPEGMYKARDIAEGLFIASKSVSGAIRKLVTDGYVDKVGKDPVVYTITEKGKNVNFEDEGEN